MRKGVKGARGAMWERSVAFGAGLKGKRYRSRLFRRHQAKYTDVSGRELKFHDVNLDDAVIATTGTVTASINLIAQGTTESERDGRKCTISKINWSYNIVLPELDAVATPANGDTVRVIMFLDKQANGAAATTADVLETTDYQSFKNLSNSSRFLTMYDKVHTINYRTLASDGAGVVSSGKVTMNGSFYKQCSIPLEFSAATGAITEIRSNNLGVLLISQEGVAAFDSKIRLRFRG